MFFTILFGNIANKIFTVKPLPGINFIIGGIAKKAITSILVIFNYSRGGTEQNEEQRR